MKLVTYVRIGDETRAQRIGALSRGGAGIVDLQSASEALLGRRSAHFENMIAFLTGRSAARQEARRLIERAPDSCILPIAAARLLAPVPRPLTLRDTMCYEQHFINAKKAGRQMLLGQDATDLSEEALKPPKLWYEMPLFYKGNVNAVIGTGEDVAFPEGEAFKDYELELAVYIGKEGRNINARHAMDHVGGYTILNDFSARFTQTREMQTELALGPALGKDFANAMGPCMVTPEEFDPANALMTVRVNGEERGRGNSGSAYHSIADVIEHVSNDTTLYPGDVIGMGTVGFGSGVEIGRPLVIGDVVELEIEGIGVLRNRVVPPEVAKIRNRFHLYKRYVCANVDGKSDFIIDDYPDVTRSRLADIWRLTETPASDSATGREDEGNAPFQHEAPARGSVFRCVSIDPKDMQPSARLLSSLPPARRKMLVDIIQDLHRTLGTHCIPNEQDLTRHLSMHRTDSLNLFVCLEGTPVTLNDEDEVNLKPGDAFVQLGSMHGWDLLGDKVAFIGGLLIDADRSSRTQLERLPTRKLESRLNKFKRYVSGTVRASDKEAGKSKVLLDDFSPNEAAIRDAEGKVIGWAGDIWRTFAAQADISGRADTVTEPMASGPSRNGITFRMIELLPHCRLQTNPGAVNYYSVIQGELRAVSQGGAIVAGSAQHVVQLRAAMALENPAGEPVLFAQFMVDAA